MTELPRIVLASGSPRRKEILTRLGYHFSVHPSDCPEDDIAGDVAYIVKTLAERKGFSVAPLEKGALIISCDTLVALDGSALGKPKDADDAKRMLRSLSGKTHEVLSGICLIDTVTGRHISDTVHTRVVFRDLSDAEIDRYVATGEPMDKAGAYAIQGGAAAFVSEYIGSFDNIVGFPAERFSEMLKELY